MKITIKPEVFKGFHNDLKLALIFVTELDNKTKLDESKHLLKEVENLERLTFHKNKKEFHHMISPWNLAKLRFGKKSVLGTKLDHWKNQRTELNLKSGSALVHIEALPPITKKQLKQIVKEAASIIESFCGAKTKVFILDKKTRTITL